MDSEYSKINNSIINIKRGFHITDFVFISKFLQRNIFDFRMNFQIYLHNFVTEVGEF